MSPINVSKRKIRHLRVRKKISGTSDSPRLSIFRSNKFIYAQIINDDENKTLVSCSSMDSEVLKDKTENKSGLSTKNFDAYKVGLAISNKCKKFPFRKISLLIEAYCIASISIMVLKIPNAQLQIVIRIR